MSEGSPHSICWYADVAALRRAFDDAVRFFVGVVSQVPDGSWDAPGLGEWTVRDLVGHTSRAMLNIEAYADAPAQEAELLGPADYFIVVLQGLARPEAVAQRGREAGRALGDDPQAAVREVAGRVVARLSRMADDDLLAIPVGAMRLKDYLPTRILELTIHSADLCKALGLESKPPALPTAVTLHLLADLAVSREAGTEVASALTGRDPLTPDFSVLG